MLLNQHAYTDLVKMVSTEEANSYEKEICLKSIMSGSKASSAGRNRIIYIISKQRIS